MLADAHKALIGVPFTDKTIEGRQGRNGHAANQKGQSRARHALAKAAHLLHVLGVHLVDDGTSAEEQQALEHGMVQQVIERAQKSQSCQQRVFEGQTHEAHAHAHEDDAHVFNGVVGKQAFDVVFRQGVHNAQHGRNSAEGQHHNTPPDRHIHAAQQVCAHLDDAKHADFDHHARHHGRGVRGRGRVRPGQPAVQREHASLCAEAEKCQQKGY